MKKKIFSVFIAVLCFTAIQAYADLTVRYEGPFVLHPQSPLHKTDITGKINLLFDGDNFSLVRVDLNNPVMGKNSYSSKEQAINLVSQTGLPSQLSVVYKLDGPVHKWYFVLVSNWTGDIFEGTIYKVADSINSIQDILKNGINTAPESWKAVGTVSLTTHL